MNGLFAAGGPLMAVLLGFGFGFVLERAGFGSGCKLTAQFRLTDWSVFKVMFTAIVFTAVGIYALEQLGLLQAEAIYVPIPYLWAIAVGGALIGAGFAVGGYCPGTSAVGVMTGRIDAIVFFVGLLVGTYLFAALFPQLDALTTAGEFTQGDRLPELLGLPEWLVLAALVAAAVGVFFLGGWFERRARAAGQS
ncbi:MAG: YeeE/YedE thiosulfate transporter family protein [Hylemonella sp.]|nr:YeeE/YedE thiosulfate transporter family protein [Hylemonella sp.]MDP1937853.1 YeeE/YedE thiosulfate transporter family protein [Hylemonella sp.]